MQSESSVPGDVSDPADVAVVARTDDTGGQVTYATESRFYVSQIIVLLFTLVGLYGCSHDPTTSSRPAPRKPYDSVELTIACDNPTIAKAFQQQTAGWVGRTGAKVTFDKTDTTADIVIVPPAEVGAWATKNDARLVPQSIRAEGQTIQWLRILTIYRDRLAAWGRENRAIPLAGEGYVLVYRADLLADPAHQREFRGRYSRALAPPATWEDVAEIAEYFAAANGQPSLPPLPSDSASLMREFHFVAACYDRPALTESALVGGRGREFDTAVGMRALSFHHDVETGKPRLTTPGFVTAADWLKKVSPYRMTAGSASDSAAALDTGSAVVALLTLAELARLPKDDDTLSDQYGIAPLPGTRGWLDPQTGAVQLPPDRVRGVNFVPYYGSAGWVGIVRETCAHPDAAFELLAELASPGRSSELLSNPALGFGPFRSEHLAQQQERIWQRYQLDPDRSRRLTESLRQFTAQTLANPAFAPRSPDQAELMAMLEKEVRRAAAGEASGSDAMAAAQTAWEQLDASRPPQQTLDWRRKSAGLE